MKNLIDQYKSLKETDNNTVLSRMKLEKMKNKIEEIYSFIEKKLTKYPNTNVTFKGKLINKRRNQAAIVIQKHFRGYLTRKIFD